MVVAANLSFERTPLLSASRIFSVFIEIFKNLLLYSKLILKSTHEAINTINVAIILKNCQYFCPHPNFFPYRHSSFPSCETSRSAPCKGNASYHISRKFPLHINYIIIYSNISIKNSQNFLFNTKVNTYYCYITLFIF